MRTALSLGPEPFPASTPWQGEARTLLERAILRHGGWPAWQRAAGISLAPTSLSGLLPSVKGAGKTFPVPSRVEVWPREAVALLHNFPSDGARGVFSADHLQLLDDREQILKEATQHRETFRGWRKNRRWTPLDALYFFGYALTHYHALPFTLVDALPLRLRTGRVRGLRLRGVEVRIPPYVHTHSAIQTFYFAEDGLLRRHDYVAEVVGTWARGAHFWDDFVLVGGLMVARRRHVQARLGSIATPIVALHASSGKYAPSRAGLAGSPPRRGNVPRCPTISAGALIRPSHIRDERALISRIDAIVPRAAMARRAGLPPEVHVGTHRELGRYS
jgi:hypothetical protein